MNAPNDAAIEVVQNYIRSLDTIGTWYGYTFEQLSYSRWAVIELLMLLKSNQSTPPLLIIETFKDKMNRYSRFNKDKSYIFSIARDVAENIIDELL